MELLNDLGYSLKVPTVDLGDYAINIPINSDFEVSFDREYRIRIVGEDGRLFESAYEGVIAVPRVDSITYRRYETERQYDDGTFEVVDVVAFHINAPVTTETNPEGVSMR